MKQYTYVILLSRGVPGTQVCGRVSTRSVYQWVSSREEGCKEADSGKTASSIQLLWWKGIVPVKIRKS